MLELMLKPLFISRGLKSETVFFASILPRRLIAPELNKKHSARDVLPPPFPDTRPMTFLFAILVPLINFLPKYPK